jgi:serine/threonine-protein kinase RsbW
MRPEGFELVVSDEGDGFRRDRVKDPLAAQNVGREGGRGLFLMEQLMDEVLYEDRGSTVILRKGDFHRLGRPRRGVPEEIVG